MSLKWNCKALFESLISCKKRNIEIIIHKQQAANINLANNKISRYNAKTVSMLNKKPKLAKPIVYFSKFVLPFRLCNCFSHSGGIFFEKHTHHEVYVSKHLNV